MAEEVLPDRFLVVRPFAKGDEAACKEILAESMRSSVGRIFWSALLRETTVHVAVFLSAVLFILVGLPLTLSAVSLPLTLMGLYVAVWANTSVKILEVQHEMTLIKQQYRRTDESEFWVADYYGPLLDARGGRGAVTCVSADELEGRDLRRWKKRLVGLLGVQRDRQRTCGAWLRRLAVAGDLQRRRVATELLNEACRFLRPLGFSALETSLDECQVEGRQFLLRRGFELEMHYHKNVLGTTAVYTKYIFRLSLANRSKSALNA